MNPLSFVVLPAPRHGAFLKFDFAFRGVRKRLSCDFSATFAQKIAAHYFVRYRKCELTSASAYAIIYMFIYTSTQTSYASEALSVYQKHKNNSPTQTAKRWGKRKNSQNFFKKTRAAPHPSLPRLTEIQYEIQYQKNNFVFHRRCNDRLNTLFLFRMQRKQYFA